MVAQLNGGRSEGLRQGGVNKSRSGFDYTNSKKKIGLQGRKKLRIGKIGSKQKMVIAVAITLRTFSRVSSLVCATNLLISFNFGPFDFVFLTYNILC